MRDALKHPTVVTGYLEGNASSLICLVWFETPNQTLNPQNLRKPTEFNSRWWKLYAIIKYRIISKKRREKKLTRWHEGILSTRSPSLLSH